MLLRLVQMGSGVGLFLVFEGGNCPALSFVEIWQIVKKGQWRSWRLVDCRLAIGFGLAFGDGWPG